MLKIDRTNQNFSLLDRPSLAECSITERYDLQEFIANSPEAFFNEIGEELFLLGKELVPSKNVQDRIDLLAIDKEGVCVVIELKRGNHKLQMMQAISYAGMISHWHAEDFLELLDQNQRESLADFLEGDIDDINRQQRVILIAEAFDYALLVGAEWLSEQFSVNISCCRIALATDSATDSEYLVCSNVYPAPELATEAISRGRGGVKRKVRWSDWETALSNVSNQAVVDYFNEQIAQNRPCYLPRRGLRYRVNGKRRLNVHARQKKAYVWQIGRFENDIAFWQERITDKESVKPVKDGRCLRMFLESKDDFEKFNFATTSELPSASWTSITDEDFDEA